MSFDVASSNLFRSLAFAAFGAGAVVLGYEIAARRATTPTTPPVATVAVPTCPTTACSDKKTEAVAEAKPEKSTESDTPSSADAQIVGIRPASAAGAARAIVNGSNGVEPIPSFPPASSVVVPTAAHAAPRTAVNFPTATPRPMFTGQTLDPGAALRQAEAHNRLALSLMGRGAWFSARAELNGSIQLIAAAADAATGLPTASRALAEATSILTEAEDFVPRSSRLDAQIDVASIVAGHRSQAVDATTLIGLTPTAARDAYLEAAQFRLTQALGSQPIGSVAAHQLGKMYAALANSSSEEVIDPRGKARVYYRAAIAADPTNFFAANDLAVLFGEEGRFEQARQLFHSCLRTSPQPTTWRNLAVVHDKLGEIELARQARAEAQALESGVRSLPGQVVPSHNIAWLPPQQFAATTQPQADAMRTAAAPQAPAPAAPQTAAPSPIRNALRGAAQPASAPSQVETTAGRPQRHALVY